MIARRIVSLFKRSVLVFLIFFFCKTNSVYSQAYTEIPTELKGGRQGDERQFKLHAKYLAGSDKNLALFFQRDGKNEFISIGEAIPESCIFEFCTLRIKISSSMKYSQIPESNAKLVIFPVTPRLEIVELIEKEKVPRSPNFSGQIPSAGEVELLAGLGIYSYDENSESSFNFYKFTQKLSYPKNFQLAVNYGHFQVTGSFENIFLPTSDVFQESIKSSLKTLNSSLNYTLQRGGTRPFLWDYALGYEFETFSFDTENIDNEVIVPTQGSLHKLVLGVSRRFGQSLLGNEFSNFRISIGEVILKLKTGLKGKQIDTNEFQRGSLGSYLNNEINFRWKIVTHGKSFISDGWLFAFDGVYEFGKVKFSGDPSPPSFSAGSLSTPKQWSVNFLIGKRHEF